jgi:hypothetical protein
VCRISPKTPSRPLCKFRLTIFFPYGILPFSFYYFVISMRSAGPEVVIGFDHSACRNSKIFAIYCTCLIKSLDDFVQAPLVGTDTYFFIFDTIVIICILLVLFLVYFLVCIRWLGWPQSSTECVDFEVIKHLYIFIKRYCIKIGTCTFILLCTFILFV